MREIYQSDRRGFFSDKKGDGAATFFGMAVLILALSSFFIFYQSSKATEASIFDARETSSVFNQNLLEFYLVQAGEEAIKKSYEEFGGYEEGVGGEIVILFRKNLVEEFKRYDFQENYFKQVYGILQEGKFETSSDKNTIILKIEGLGVVEDYEGISVKHNPKIHLKFDLRKYRN